MTWIGDLLNVNNPRTTRMHEAQSQHRDCFRASWYDEPPVATDEKSALLLRSLPLPTLSSSSQSSRQSLVTSCRSFQPTLASELSHFKITMLAAASAFTLLALAAVSEAGFERVHSHASRATKLPDYIAQNLGPYSPYYAAGTYPAPPVGCSIDQVNILQRHGARFPTANAGKKIKASIAKLKTATSFDSSLTFVPSYTFTLGADNLNPLGAQESYEAGQLAGQRYASLAADSSLIPFLRADSSQRVVDSASNWTAGFVTNAGVVKPSSALIINDASGSNDTLDDNNCDNAPGPDAFENAWLAVFMPNITARINAAAPGANISDSDTLNLMQLCGFDTEYLQVLSPWCGLFKQSEWSSFEYYFDLDKWYGTGYGNALGAIQGVGYVNELLSRVTGDLKYATNDQTQVNHTLDSNAATFPLDRKLYADFSHDNQITAILAAMGLKNGPQLTTTTVLSTRSWVTSQIVPFSGRLVTERMKCADNKEYVRFLINDQLQPADFCGGGNSGGSRICLVSDFVASQKYSTNNGNGDYLKCGYTPL
ncbi:phosphoglycerate mutase-like protein [Meredithblackwellia eburnea MCA 4105]